MITHSLSTAVIGPDGKIVKWYHGSDWQPSDLIKTQAMRALRGNSEGITSLGRARLQWLRKESALRCFERARLLAAPQVAQNE